MQLMGVFDSLGRYLRCPIGLQHQLGGLINMTKKRHVWKFMDSTMDARLQMATIVFTMPFDWYTNRFPCRQYFNDLGFSSLEPGNWQLEPKP